MSKEFLPTILKQKEQEVAAMSYEELQPLRSTYSLYEYLKNHPQELQLIAEVKKASPSLGDINLGVDSVEQARTYERCGAAMISLQELYDFAAGLGLEVLVETHNLAELETAHRIGARIIGVNNRNLVTFETDINTSLQLSAHFKDDRVYVSESAIFSKEDAELVAPYFHAVLVGTALMQAEDVAEKIKELKIDKG